jgi:hypothetical protein
MIHVGDFLAEAERYKDLLAEVERERQIRLPAARQTAVQRTRLSTFYAHWMLRLGYRLEAWGCWLQTRYVAQGRTG